MMNPPGWLEQLANDAVSEMLPIDILAPVGCHFHCDETNGQWEVTIFASRTEVVGGKYDGRLTESFFSLDLAAVSRLFDAVSSLHWHVVPSAGPDELGPHVSIEGLYDGHLVWLRMAAAAPEAMPVGRLVDVHAADIIDQW